MTRNEKNHPKWAGSKDQFFCYQFEVNFVVLRKFVKLKMEENQKIEI